MLNCFVVSCVYVCVCVLQPIRKRKIAILMTERKRMEAIKELTEYLES